MPEIDTERQRADDDAININFRVKLEAGHMFRWNNILKYLGEVWRDILWLYCFVRGTPDKISSEKSLCSGFTYSGQKWDGGLFCHMEKKQNMVTNNRLEKSAYMDRKKVLQKEKGVVREENINRELKKERKLWREMIARV